MRPRAIWDRGFYLAKALQWLFGVFGMLIPISEKIPLNKTQQYFPAIAPCIKWAQDSTWWVAPICMLIAGFSTVVMKWIGEPWAWQIAASLITGFRNQIFKLKKDPVHHHRVTLFKCRRWCFTRKHGRIFWRPPWKRWLRSTIRSCHTTLQSRPTFAIPDDAENVEGIAGLAWSTRATIYEVNLPQLQASSIAHNFKRYAERTKMDVKEVEALVHSGKNFARSFCAFPVESDNGEIWGVIVIDSQDPILLPENEITGLFFPVAQCLTKLISRL